MTTKELARLYKRDIERFITEIELFNDENNLLKTKGSAKNSSGNLTLHIIGGLSFHIGVTLANLDFVRNRNQEFIRKGVPRESMTAQLSNLIPLIVDTITSMPDRQLNELHPNLYDGQNETIGYVLTQILLHLNYHLGQINYLRRMLE